jgi:hypothetical protein
MTRQQHALYHRAYPALLCQIDHLRALLQEHDDNVALVVLFGSTARLTPHLTSDADLLIIVQQQDVFYQRSSQATQGVALLVAAEWAAMERGGWEWPFISLVEEDVSALPPALLENIVRDGVLLHHRQGVSLPTSFAQMLPYETWRQRVEALLMSSSSPAR